MSYMLVAMGIFNVILAPETVLSMDTCPHPQTVLHEISEDCKCKCHGFMDNLSKSGLWSKGVWCVSVCFLLLSRQSMWISPWKLRRTTSFHLDNDCRYCTTPKRHQIAVDDDNFHSPTIDAIRPASSHPMFWMMCLSIVFAPLETAESPWFMAEQLDPLPSKNVCNRVLSQISIFLIYICQMLILCILMFMLTLCWSNIIYILPTNHVHRFATSATGRRTKLKRLNNMPASPFVLLGPRGNCSRNLRRHTTCDWARFCDGFSW